MSSMVLQSAVSKRQLVFLSGIVVLSLVLFVVWNLAALNQNDFMYAMAPAVWAQNGALYTDVPFLQVPLSLLLNSLLVTVTGNANIFLSARIVSMVLVLLAVLLPVLSRSKTRNFVVFALYVALCLTNLFVASNSAEIGNYALSLFFLSAAVTAINAPGSAMWRGFTAAAFAGLATSAKLYFIFVCPALFLFFLVNERAARDPVVIAACGFGFLLALTPILYFVARDYQSFWRCNVQIPGLILPLKMGDPTVGFLRLLNATIVFALLMAIPIGFVVAATLKQLRRGGPELHKEWTKHLLLISAFIMAISPIFIYEQYLGPLAFLLLLFSAPWNSTKDATRSLFVILAGAMLCMQCVIMVRSIYRDVMPDGNLAVAQVLKIQNKARQIVDNDYICERKFYSAAPLFLLENGVKYPPELAAGPFLMFMRGEALAQKGQAFDLVAHIEKWNPDVVIWGYYLDNPDPYAVAVDRTIRDYAVGRNFVVVPLGKIRGRAMQLAYRAGCKTPPRS